MPKNLGNIIQWGRLKKLGIYIQYFLNLVHICTGILLSLYSVSNLNMSLNKFNVDFGYI
jgi:hypothetical protein